jgi:hypothetical protein
MIKYSKTIMKQDRALISIAGELATQRSYNDLLFIIREQLPAYFEFQGVSIIFRDTKTNQLFALE